MHSRYRPAGIFMRSFAMRNAGFINVRAKSSIETSSRFDFCLLREGNVLGSLEAYRKKSCCNRQPSKTGLTRFLSYERESAALWRFVGWVSADVTSQSM